LLILAASPDEEPPKQVIHIRISCISSTIQHIS
jgi:hypothetical protein